MNSKTSQVDIEKCESNFNKKLPLDYTFFLLKFNGGVLFKIADYAGFKFLSTEELIKHNSFQKENLENYWDSEIILFCECIGDAEYLGFKFNDNGLPKVVYCIMDIIPEKWAIIENTFEDLINKLIEERGRKYWLDSV